MCMELRQRFCCSLNTTAVARSTRCTSSTSGCWLPLIIYFACRPAAAAAGADAAASVGEHLRVQPAVEVRVRSFERHEHAQLRGDPRGLRRQELRVPLRRLDRVPALRLRQQQRESSSVSPGGPHMPEAASFGGGGVIFSPTSMCWVVCRVAFIVLPSRHETRNVLRGSITI